MAVIVGVHGIGQQHKGESELHAEWFPALTDGLRRAQADELPSEGGLTCAFYGDLFRPQGAKALGDPPFNASHIEDKFEQELLEALWVEAAKTDSRVRGPDSDTKVRTPKVVQRALLALTKSSFFTGIAQRAFIADLKQVSAYMTDQKTREEVRRRVIESIGDDTRVVVGHSLGSVVAYEVLANGEDSWRVDTLVTVGSPLGIPNLIFDRLEPGPVDGLGVWPRVRRWVNIADDGDVVALAKSLSPRFGDDVQDLRVNNGAKAHSIRPYLNPIETGQAIAAGLSD